MRFFGKRRMAALAAVLDNKTMDAKQRKAAATGLLTRCRYVMLEGASRDNKWSVQFLPCGREVTRWWLRGVGRCRGWPDVELDASRMTVLAQSLGWSHLLTHLSLRGEWEGGLFFFFLRRWPCYVWRCGVDGLQGVNWVWTAQW